MFCSQHQERQQGRGGVSIDSLTCKMFPTTTVQKQKKYTPLNMQNICLTLAHNMTLRNRGRWIIRLPPFPKSWRLLTLLDRSTNLAFLHFDVKSFKVELVYQLANKRTATKRPRITHVIKSANEFKSPYTTMYALFLRVAIKDYNYSNYKENTILRCRN